MLLEESSYSHTSVLIDKQFLMQLFKNIFVVFIITNRVVFQSRLICILPFGNLVTCFIIMVLLVTTLNLVSLLIFTAVTYPCLPLIVIIVIPSIFPSSSMHACHVHVYIIILLLISNNSLSVPLAFSLFLSPILLIVELLQIYCNPLTL